MNPQASTAEELNLRLMAKARRYHGWIYDMMKDHIRGDRLLEIGAGVGNLTRLLIQRGGHLTCTDVNPRNLEELAVAFPGVHIVLDDLAETRLEETYDTIACVNVLEHIADDVRALRNLRRLMAADGRLVLLVPAVPGAYGTIDRADGHHRRYSRGELRTKLAETGFETIDLRYMNAPGLLGWWWEGRVLKRDLHSSQALTLLDRLVPLLMAIERVMPPPIGLSLVAAARPAGSGAHDASGVSRGG